MLYSIFPLATFNASFPLLSTVVLYSFAAATYLRFEERRGKKPSISVYSHQTGRNKMQGHEATAVRESVGKLCDSTQATRVAVLPVLCMSVCVLLLP